MAKNRHRYRRKYKYKYKCRRTCVVFDMHYTQGSAAGLLAKIPVRTKALSRTAKTFLKLFRTNRITIFNASGEKLLKNFPLSSLTRLLLGSATSAPIQGVINKVYHTLPRLAIVLPSTVAHYLIFTASFVGAHPPHPCLLKK